MSAQEIRFRFSESPKHLAGSLSNECCLLSHPSPSSQMPEMLPACSLVPSVSSVCPASAGSPREWQGSLGRACMRREIAVGTS